ncbi:hypothetical protein BK732_13260 [Bacillus thuringiensis serovar navarrensis]|uniref:Uncharacterized protein n=1 Tax=Bacillus thuringiensis serovar navarrensis TaxID=339658 RepID=A0A243ADG3_BACTU|nr:hypothetical protein BK732_13260 [Bacillus thuringiensis serovar navarrensis]
MLLQLGHTESRKCDHFVYLVLVQKLQDNCNKSTNLGHTDTTNLKKVRDWYGKGKFIQMETLSA